MLLTTYNLLKRYKSLSYPELIELVWDFNEVLNISSAVSLIGLSRADLLHIIEEYEDDYLDYFNSIRKSYYVD